MSSAQALPRTSLRKPRQTTASNWRQTWALTTSSRTQRTLRDRQGLQPIGCLGHLELPRQLLACRLQPQRPCQTPCCPCSSTTILPTWESSGMRAHHNILQYFSLHFACTGSSFFKSHSRTVLPALCLGLCNCMDPQAAPWRGSLMQQ